MKITKEEIKQYKDRMDMITPPAAVKTIITLVKAMMEGNPSMSLAAFQNDEYTEYYLLNEIVEAKEKYQPSLTLIKNTLGLMYLRSTVGGCDCSDIADLYYLYENIWDSFNDDNITELITKIDELLEESDDDECIAFLKIISIACKYMLD